MDTYTITVSVTVEAASLEDAECEAAAIERNVGTTGGVEVIDVGSEVEQDEDERVAKATA
jgi:hypothetical protein